MKRFTVKQDSDLKNFTDCTYPQGSFFFNALLRRGDIRVNGVKRRENVALSAGDEVVFYTSLKEEDKPSHAVIYQDENVYIADKPGGVTSEALFCELEDKGLLPVHRLDRNTCGLIVLSKTATAQEELIRAFKERAVEKRYLCFARNSFKKPGGVLTAYLKKDGSGTVKIYPGGGADRVKIITEYTVEESFGDYARVGIILHTGKTHQIRAHLAYIGCPVLGDTKYGDFALNKKYGATRQILVAKSLSFKVGGLLSYLNGKTFTSGYSPELPPKR